MATDAISVIASDHREVEGLFRQFSDDPTADRADIVGQLIHELSVHAAAEEMILYPAVRKVPDGDLLADQALGDHQEVKQVLDRLDGMDSEDDEVALLVTELESMVNEHVRIEEDQLLTVLRSAMSAEELEDMGQSLERAKRAAPTRPHPGAPDRPPANIIMGAPMGLIDRIRDAVAGRG